MTELDKILKQIEAARLASEKRTVNTNALAEIDPLHEITDNTVTKSHSLTRAYYRFGIVEKRCMEALISKLNPLRSDNKHQEVELSALEYAATYGVSEKHAYRDLGAAIDALMHRVIRVDRSNGKAGKVELTIMLKAEYKDDEGCISCAFNPFITPHLIGLREKFSSYPLSKAVEFSSSYTWRFYEILSSWVDKKKTGGRFMGWIDRQGVDELREMLGVTESYNWGMFQKKVLNVIETELREKANIFVHFERKKTGRKITHLNIKFAESEQQQLPLQGGAGS